MDFNEPHVHQNGENRLNMVSFNLQGAYVDNLKTSYTIEQKR